MSTKDSFEEMVRGDMKCESGVYELLSEDQIQILLAAHEAATAQAQQERQEKNKSFCGCPMCLHHTEPYALAALPSTPSNEEINLCKQCNTAKHLNAEGLCGRCATPSNVLDEGEE